LAQKAQEAGYHPEIILAGRRLNDSMGEYVATQVIKTMIKKDIRVNGAEILMLGITFKENCPDVRNTKMVDVIKALEDYNVKITIYDPWANPEAVMHEYGLSCYAELSQFSGKEFEQSFADQTQQGGAIGRFDAVVLGVAHNEFLSLDLQSLKKDISVVYDVKGILGSHADGKL
jgi:UDP-N-acetyl-D-galactosamine dehydrogenase